LKNKQEKPKIHRLLKTPKLSAKNKTLSHLGSRLPSMHRNGAEGKGRGETGGRTYGET